MTRRFARLMFALNLIAAIALFSFVASSGAAGHAALSATAQPTAAPTGSGLPNNARLLESGKPLTDTLDSKTAIRFYKFEGKAGELYRLSVEATSGNIWTATSIASADFTRILAATAGDTLIDAAVRVVIPDSGEYAVTVEYIEPTIGTPAPGSYTITLTKVK